jgi:hypothetical protein
MGTFISNLNTGLVKSTDSVTSDYWLVGDSSSGWTGNNSFFRTQAISCSYPINGSYGATSRILYYILAIIGVIFRKESWAANAAIATVMVYSATAAIHAIMLLTITRQMGFDYWQRNYEWVLALGQTNFGIQHPDEKNSTYWLMVSGFVDDEDVDPALAIVGFALLLLLPISIWSSTFEKATNFQKRMVLGWSILLCVGLVSAFVGNYYINFQTYSQYRFCPLDSEDTLPISSRGRLDFPKEENNYFRWNETLNQHFVLKNANKQYDFQDKCLYPCFQAQSLLRDPTDIVAMSQDFGDGHVYSSPSLETMFAIYIMVACTAAAGLTVVLIKWADISDWNSVSIGESRDHIREIWASKTYKSVSGFWRLILRLWIHVVILYAYFISPLSVAILLVYMEWVIWAGDLPTESFRHVGQWGVLFSAALVLGAALAPEMSRILRNKENDAGKDIETANIPEVVETSSSIGLKSDSG